MQIISYAERPSSLEDTESASKVSQVAVEHVLQKILDLVQSFRTGLEPPDEQLQGIWTKFYTSDACPQSVSARLRELLAI